jgi:hypothetical protein
MAHVIGATRGDIRHLERGLLRHDLECPGCIGCLGGAAVRIVMPRTDAAALLVFLMQSVAVTRSFGGGPAMQTSADFLDRLAAAFRTALGK